MRSPTLLPIVLKTDIFAYNSPIFPSIANFCMHFALIAPKPMKDILLKGDLFYNDGTYYKTYGMAADKTGSALDLNLGVQFNLMPKLDLFMQFNNIFNTNYQKWNRYQVLGFNVLGGVVYSFR